MPVTKTARRALRGSKKKALVNKLILTKLEKAIRSAKKTRTVEKVRLAVSLADRAVKKRFIHKNKAARIKSALSKLLPKAAKTKNSKPSKKKS